MAKGAEYTMEWTLKRDWIDALRSGKYKQARGLYIGRTASGTAYCCLGVERVVAVGRWDNKPPSTIGDISRACENHCIALNDDEGRDFNYIADWIEDNVRAVL